MSLHTCRVVLVRSEVAANIGATARIMRNMGLRELVLVEPVANPSDREARRLSTHGEEVLDRARIVADLGEAVADCGLVAGTSARVGGLFRRQSVGTPEEVMPRLVDALTAGPAALVFGPEPSGLTNEEVTRCHYLIHIPADPAYPALNLAQAVAICLYELRRAWLFAARNAERGTRSGSDSSSTPRSTLPAGVASFADQERMFEQLRDALERVHFLYGPGAGPLMHALRHLIGRAGPTPMEVEMLFGLARQLRWYTDHMRSPKESLPDDARLPEGPP